MSEDIKIPKHVAIIMDGNGRWATLRGKKRTFGHKAGSDNVDLITAYAFNHGIKTLTLYAFSCENWQRPQEEVDELMRLLKVYFKKFIKKIISNKIHLFVSGDISRLSPDLQDIIKETDEKTKMFTEHTLNLAINYGAKQEIVMAVNKLIKENKEITVDNISSALYTAPFGEPDLIIRTGGELRLSNFMLYQGAYSELYFTDVLWPDFNEEEFEKALKSFSERKRRFGKV
ncbi:MAG: di-trans,poly-cis-decaprenylcistransferase [Firmicutes bacterium]|nr:di-trans,poly-cis-decaprenylcistransferase [Candidatus Caballimonas caccae]